VNQSDGKCDKTEESLILISPKQESSIGSTGSPLLVDDVEDDNSLEEGDLVVDVSSDGNEATINDSESLSSEKVTTSSSATSARADGIDRDSGTGNGGRKEVVQVKVDSCEGSNSADSTTFALANKGVTGLKTGCVAPKMMAETTSSTSTNSCLVSPPPTPSPNAYEVHSDPGDMGSSPQKDHVGALDLSVGTRRAKTAPLEIVPRPTCPPLLARWGHKHGFGYPAALDKHRHLRGVPTKK